MLVLVLVLELVLVLDAAQVWSTQEEAWLSACPSCCAACAPDDMANKVGGLACPQGNCGAALLYRHYSGGVPGQMAQIKIVPSQQLTLKASIAQICLPSIDISVYRGLCFPALFYHFHVILPQAM